MCAWYSWLIVLFEDSVFCWSSVSWKWGPYISNYYWNVYFSQFCQFLLFVFHGSVIRGKYIYECSIFLRLWLFYHDKMSIVSSSNVYIKVCFVWYCCTNHRDGIATPVLFWLLFGYIPFFTLVLSPYLVFESKVYPCKEHIVGLLAAKGAWTCIWLFLE